MNDITKSNNRGCDTCAWQVLLGDTCACMRENKDASMVAPRGLICVENGVIWCRDWNNANHTSDSRKDKVKKVYYQSKNYAHDLERVQQSLR